VNYLAHAYLSGEDEDILVGNFIADAVKGKTMNDFSGNIRRGIILHRFIDEFTDNHPLHKASRAKLHQRYGHYSGVLIDIYYDHFLAKNWHEYSDQPLVEYTDWLYGSLEKQMAILPERIKYMLKYMIPQNWLLNYAHLDGISRVLKGMARRAKFNSQMEHGVEDLELYYDEFKTEFSQFFPLLKEFVLHKLPAIK
jgi:acyl carrier protein phosphodiesterase